MVVIGDLDKKSFGAMGSREKRKRGIEDRVDSDFVSRIVTRESRVIGLWLKGHEVLEFFLFLGRQTL